MLENLVVNLRAKGPAAVLIAWMLCFTALALFGKGSLVAYALGALGAFGVFLLGALGQKVQ